MGGVTFDSGTGRFEISVSPDPEVIYERPGNDSVRQAIVAIKKG